MFLSAAPFDWAVKILSEVKPHSSSFWIVNVVFPPKARPQQAPNNNTPPVVIVPGNLGNRLEAKLDKPNLVHWLCYKKTNWFTLWIDLNMLMPIGVDCWIDNMRLVYNRTSRRSSNSPGVQVRVPGFGQTYPIEFLDSSRLAGYFHTMVQQLVNMGYTRNETVRGAPYDWRLAPNENKEYFLQLQRMIEEMASKAGGPVVLIAHSMGNMYTLYFLSQQPQAWKDKYIKAFISLGPPWAGVAKTLRVLISGDNNRIPVISSLKIRAQQRTAVSTSWLLPYAHTWPNDKVLVQTPTVNYTVLDHKRLYTDIGFEDGWMMRQDTEPLVTDLAPPGVAVHCLYGSGLLTPEAFRYSDKFPDVDPTVVYGDGDGTVNLLSAKQCGRWVGRQKQPVVLKELPGNEHVNMLLNYTTVAYIKSVL
uniref:Phospholipase A2, group XV n=1 Tax=Tetraodon nigroviridis TaxID=99883 RepID=H3CE10_TETNG